MHRRTLRAAVATAGLLALAVPALPPPAAASSSIVISELRVRGPAGGNDELIELYNPTAAAVDVGGWTINGSNNAGTIGVRSTLPTGTTIGAGCHYLLANGLAGGYSGSVPPDRTYTTGITDDGGLALID